MGLEVIILYLRSVNSELSREILYITELLGVETTKSNIESSILIQANTCPKPKFNLRLSP